jgi:tetratricopeptide (TPR) repeat protein
MPPTVRPDPTVGGGPATQAPVGAGSSRALVLGGAAALLLAGTVGGVLWVRGRTTPQAPAGQEPGNLTEVIVTNGVELARADLANKDYESAVRRAEDVLKLAPASAEARGVLDQARGAQRQISDAVAEARDAFGRGDTNGASVALGRVMTLDPRQPVIGELSAALKEHFRPQAEDGRRQADAARKSAEAARAISLPGFTQGQKLVTEGEGFFRRQDYAAAAQKYLESRDAFERATRQAIEARTVAARPSPSPSVYPVALVTPSPLAPTAQPAPTVSPTAEVALPPVAIVPPPPPTTLAPVPATPRSAGSDAEVRQVIAEYGRAMEARDLALYRTLKPSLSSEDEKRLREAFKASKTQRVGITVDSVQVEGDRATVRATRQDVIDGRPTKAVAQTFQLVRVGATWQIQ